MDAALELSGLHRRYGDVRAVDGVDLIVRSGERFALLGPSGSGKTTILRLIAGFESPDAGTVSLAGEPVGRLPPEARNIGVVFQDYALFPHRTVAHNIEFGLRMHKVPKDQRRDRVQEMIQLVGLTREAGRRPDQLSGGQRQRVALARALAPSPRLLLLDEPLGNLDRRLRESLRDDLVEITAAVGITSVLVTHDQEEALSFADRVGVLRDGRLVQVGTPTEVWRAPTDTFVATFLGDMNLLPLDDIAPADPARVKVVGVTGDLELRSDAEAGNPRATATSVACLRPEALDLRPADSTTAGGHGRVVGVSYAGGSVTYVVEVAGLRLKIRRQQPDGAASFAVGDAVQVMAVVEAVSLLAVDPLAG